MDPKKILETTLRKPFAELRDIDLIGSGLLDSLTIMDLIAEAEKRLGRVLSIEDLNNIDFRSAESVVSFLERF